VESFSLKKRKQDVSIPATQRRCVISWPSCFPNVHRNKILPLHPLVSSYIRFYPQLRIDLLTRCAIGRGGRIAFVRFWFRDAIRNARGVLQR